MEYQQWQERCRMLVGEQGCERLAASAVAVAGLGGVGGYAAEMVVRAGVGRIVIIDSDVVSPTNKNRQLLALDSTMGKFKCDVMERRLKDINPEVEIVSIKQYLDEENIPSIMASVGRIDYLIDAIDTLAPKIALICHCMENGIPLVSSMGAGAKFDATKIRLTDISKSYNCPLAFILRKKLRKRGISRGFSVVFSEELPQRSAIVPSEGERNKKSQVGTFSYIPPVFGCICAQAALNYLIDKKDEVCVGGGEDLAAI